MINTKQTAHSEAGCYEAKWLCFMMPTFAASQHSICLSISICPLQRWNVLKLACMYLHAQCPTRKVVPLCHITVKTCISCWERHCRMTHYCGIVTKFISICARQRALFSTIYVEGDHRQTRCHATGRYSMMLMVCVCSVRLHAQCFTCTVFQFVDLPPGSIVLMVHHSIMYMT